MWLTRLPSNLYAYICGAAGNDSLVLILAMPKIMGEWHQVISGVLLQDAFTCPVPWEYSRGEWHQVISGVLLQDAFTCPVPRK
jgi:hypothetical protein